MVCPNCGNCGEKIVKNDFPIENAESQNQAEKSNSDQHKVYQVSKRPWYLSTPIYLISWLAVLGTVSAILIGPSKPQNGMALSFWIGCITAITMKRKNKSGLLWFIIGFVPIGFSFYFLLIFFKRILSHY